MYVYDLETFVKNNGYLQCYAAGFIELKKEEFTAKDRDLVKIFFGLDSIYNTIKYINDTKPKLPYIVKNKSGKCKSVLWKQSIVMYAHYGSWFDSYVVLHDKLLQKMPGFKWKSIIKNQSGILCLAFSTYNCNFKLMCSYTQLSFSLKKLCANFNISADISKE